MKKSNLRYLLVSAMVAAIYFVFTVVPTPFSYGAVQFRFAEIMVLLVFVDKRYIPGLIIGCFLANLAGPFGIIDAILGTLGSVFSVIMIAMTAHFGVRGSINNFNKNRARIIAALYVSSLWPVLSSLIIAFGLMLAGELAAYWSLVGSIAFGEFVVISMVGVPLFIYILSRPSILKVLKISDKV